MIYTYGPPFVPVQTFRGLAQSHRLRLALAQLQTVMVELIQPLSGDSIYFEHLDRKGPGLHHVGVFVPSFDAALEEAAQRGYTVLQMGRGYGRWGDGGFAYLDTEDALGMILELIEIPRERFPPENVYPLR